MKIGLMFANVAFFGQPDHLVNLVQSAEQAGVESLWTVEHVVVPKGYKSKYPYSKDGRMPGPENSPIPDPLIWLSYAAAVTSKIKLATGILILPQRHPAYVAKEVATLDTLSKGRVMLGVGIGWMKDEFDVLGIPFEERASRTEESIQAIRSLWSEGTSSFEGKHYQWDELESNPKPPGGRVPIHIGGHVKGAARRAARYGDGFFPVNPDDMPRLLEVLNAECAEIGRDPSEIELTTGFPAGFDLDQIKRFEDMGVSRLVLGPPAFDPEGVKKGLGELGNAIAKL